MANISNDILQSESNLSFEEKSSFYMDLTKVLIYFIITAFLFVYGFSLIFFTGDLLYTVFGVICLFVSSSSFVANLKEFYGIIHYQKAQKELGFYLKGVKPVCPYLRVDSRGFRCLIEFDKPFNISEDLPKCHNEDDSVLHWEEKAPEVFERLKVDSSKNILTYILALGGAKYTPAIPYLVDMINLPNLTKEYMFIVNNVNQVKDLESLQKNYLEYVNPVDSNTTVSDPNYNSSIVDYNNQFEKSIEKLVQNNILSVSDQNVSLTELSNDPSFINKWRLYSSSVVKQYTVAALVPFESEKLIPIFLDIISTSEDKKMHQLALNGLKKQKERSSDIIINSLNDESVPEKVKLSLLEISGHFESDEMYSFLENIIQNYNADNELFTAYAISSIGKFGDKGRTVVMNVLANHPGDLILETGRATLVKSPNITFKLITEKLKEDNLQEGFIQILESIIEDIDHKLIKSDLNNLTDDELDEIEDLFIKYGLDDLLDLFMPE